MNRLRRVVNRALGWLVGAVASVLAVLLLVLAIYILFFDYPDHIKAWMEAEASRILGREIRITQFSVNLPNSFELRGVAALPLESGPPWLEFESLRGELKLFGILQRQIQLSLLEVDGLVVRIQDYGGGQVDLPGLWGPTVSRPSVAVDASFTFLADRIRFDDASFVYNNRNLPWRLEATKLIAQLDREGRGMYRGLLSYDHGRLEIKNRPWFENAAKVQLEVAGKELRLLDFQAEGPFYVVRGEGSIGLGAEPRAQIALEAESRVSPAARSLLGLHQLEDAGSAPASFVGDLSMGRGWHQVRGHIEVPAARFAGIPLRNWEGEIYWDRSILEISSARGALAGGGSQLQIRQPLPVADHPIHISAQLQDVPLQDLVQAATGEPGPLASNVSGSVNLLVPEDPSPVFSGDFELRGAPPPDAPEQTGVEFSVRGEIDHGDLHIAHGRFVSDIASGEFSGSYPWSDSVDLRLDSTILDLTRADRVQQKLRTLFRPESPARTLGVSGMGRIVGRVTGRLPRLAFEGDFQGADVSFRSAAFGRVEARGRWNADAIHVESFDAHKDGARISGTGELALGSETPQDWAVQGDVHRWRASELFELLQIPVPIDGELSAEGKFSSQAGEQTGEGTAVVSAGSLFAVAFDRAEAGIKLQGQRVLLESLSMARREARVQGRLVFDRETMEIGGELVSRRFPIAVFSTDSVDLKGEMEAKLALGGAVDLPEVAFEADIRSMAIGGIAVGDARLEARLESGTARASVSVQGEAFELEGRTRTQILPGYPTEGDLRWQSVDIGPWLRSVPAGLPESIRFLSDGEASFEGQIDSLDSLSADSVMENIRFEVGGYRFKSSGPMKAHLRQGMVQIEELRLAGEDTQVTLAGELPLREGNLDLVAKGSVDLDILEGFFASLSSSGRVELSARVRGNWEHPSLSGYADLSSGVVRAQGFPQALGDVQGRVSFDNRTVRFPDIQALFGGAPVNLSGTLVLRGFRPDSFELRLSGQGLRLRYPEGLVATLNANLRMNGTARSQLLGGRIEVDEATWSREYDLATGILVDRDTEGLGLLENIDLETPLSNLKFDVEVVMPGTLRIQNSRASVDARAELQLRGTFAHPALLGRMEALRGEVFLLGQRYQLVSGRVEFLDPSTVKPFFDFVAESRVRSYRVELRLSGTPDRFFPELSSEPPLRTVDILRLLAGASERDILIGSEEEEVAGVGVASLLTERLTQEVGRRAERLFGLDRFSIDPFLVGQYANPTARVSIGKQIYRDLSVSYSTNLNAATETLILIEYTPEGPISWIISRDEEGAFGVDLRFRKSF